MNLVFSVHALQHLGDLVVKLGKQLHIVWNPEQPVVHEHEVDDDD